MKKFTSILLASLLLFSNFSFTLNTHFCGGHATQKVLSLAKAELRCGTEEQLPVKSCEEAKSNFKLLKQKSCCENEHLLIQSDLDFQIKSELQNNAFKSLISIVSLELLQETAKAEFFDFYYPQPPPLLKERLQLLFQVFRI